MRPAINDEFDIRIMDDGEDEEYGPESDRSRARKSEDESEIHMSLCLNAF